MIWAISAGQPDLAARARVALEAGLDRLLVREAAPPAGLEALIGDFPGRVVVHARMAGAEALARAHGVPVHLGAAHDLRVWRELAPAVGQSCHAPDEARGALRAGAAWVFLSPIAAPFSKPHDVRPTLGLAALHGVGAVALGGIHTGLVAACRANGAVGVASLSGILTAADPASAVGTWRAAWGGAAE